MIRCNHLLAVWLGVSCFAVFQGLGAESVEPVWRVLPAADVPDDVRLGPARTLRDQFHPWTPPNSLEEWKQAADAIRERLLVSSGLWPMPEKTPMNPVIHGTIDRGDYTIDKVYFASRPGHYVTGNLYRPKQHSGKMPGVLCPHGHWANGRFYDAGDKKAQEQVKLGAEQFDCGAHYPLQARMVQLARMGCIVFHYDMVGYADSQPISHRDGLNDVEAALWLHNILGLQTFNSIRALDFLLALPDVDSRRIGVTGASGGGTQTFMVCAIDPRPAVAFPAVMVSTNMQGGCVCENADYLRIGINNIAIAALCAPKPLAMSGADDWTIDIETKGLPELRSVYGLYGKSDLVSAKCFPQFKHNYNQVSRQLMYDWFNRHLNLGWEEAVKEKPFDPVPPKELSVFDDAHPLPKEAKSASELRDTLRQADRKWFASLLPKDAKNVDEYRTSIGTAARIMLDQGVPDAGGTECDIRNTSPVGKDKLEKGTLTRSGAGEQIPWIKLTPKDWDGTVVAWFDGRGKSSLFDEKQQPISAVKRLLKARWAVVSADLFQTGEFVAEGRCTPRPSLVDPHYSGYTFGYNRPWLSQRVRDVLTVLGWIGRQDGVKRVHLAGTGTAGSWTLLARALAGDQIARTVADLRGFGFERIHDPDDPMFLPGALKYGGIGGLAALAAPGELHVAGTRGVSENEIEPLQRVYAATNGSLVLEAEGLTPDAVVDRLLR